MEQYILKSALVAEIDSWRDNIIKSISDIPLTGRDRADATFEYEILGKIKDFLDFFEVKVAKEEPVSVWHDANQQPTMYRKYLVRYSDGRVSGSWERHDDGFIPWKDVVKEHGFTHWCYVEDLIKL